MNNNFWGYVKIFFKKKSESFPSFDLAQCTIYFTKSLSAVFPNKTFNISSWIPKFNAPTSPFNLDPSTYNEITNVIRKMKPSGSPCPLDQISVISLKRCPYLRTYLTEIIQTSWSSGAVPSEWKKACTILIHKKDETDNPANFRPITLESVSLKVFTSCLRNKIFDFLSENNYIEHNIQKGFTPKVSGSIEHTAHMAHIINTARTKQRSLVITLLDLKNAFGELHHNLIYEVLKYHHIPDPINELIRSLYTNFQTSIITKQFSTPFITVGRGVLQGDCLSPLLFNMSFNTFVQHIKSESYTQLGFWKFNKSGIPCNPIHWFQFANDAAVISSQEKENQILLNRFSVWCQWANMIIRVDALHLAYGNSHLGPFSTNLNCSLTTYLYPVSKSVNLSAILVDILILTCQMQNTNRRYVTCLMILYQESINYLYTPKIKFCYTAATCYLKSRGI